MQCEGSSKLNVSSAEIEPLISESIRTYRTQTICVFFTSKLKGRIDFVPLLFWLCFCVSALLCDDVRLLYDGWKCVRYIIIASEQIKKVNHRWHTVRAPNSFESWIFDLWPEILNTRLEGKRERDGKHWNRTNGAYSPIEPIVPISISWLMITANNRLFLSFHQIFIVYNLPFAIA